MYITYPQRTISTNQESIHYATRVEFHHTSSLFFASDVFGLLHFSTEILLPNAQYVVVAIQTQFQSLLIGSPYGIPYRNGLKKVVLKNTVVQNMNELRI